jgi:predicted GIY-YIG superfamily endonuclease
VKDDDAIPPRWSVYVLVSASATRTYVGVSTDPERRLREHNGEKAGGARSTRPGRPWAIARILGPYSDRAAAQRAEHALKKKRGRHRIAAAPS